MRQSISTQLKKTFDEHGDPKDDEMLDIEADSCVGAAIIHMDGLALLFCRVFEEAVVEQEAIWEAVRHQARIYYFG